jgi:hypothetical protein
VDFWSAHFSSVFIKLKIVPMLLDHQVLFEISSLYYFLPLRAGLILALNTVFFRHKNPIEIVQKQKKRENKNILSHTSSD